jgi:hypothetical protein
MPPMQARSRERQQPAAFESRWALHRMRANEAAAAGRRQLAESHFLEALRLARVALGLARHESTMQGDAAITGWIAIWVDSHLGFAGFLADGGEFETALSLAFEGYEALVTCLHDATLDPTVHRACLARLRPLIDGLRDLMDRGGMPACDRDRVLSRAQALALGYWNVWT